MGILTAIPTVEAQHIELGQIIVAARRIPVGLGEVTENVTVVTEDEIQKIPARNLSEALKYIPGVDVDPRPGFGQPASISIQGSDSRHVKVMVDGIPLNSQVSEQVDPSRLPLQNIARIEVIKGAASSIWGSSLGGVINIITKDTGKTLLPEGNFTASFAEFRTKKESMDLSGKAGDVGYYLFSSYMESGGRNFKADVVEKKSFSKVSYNLGEMGEIIASFGYSGADVNSGVYPDETWMSQPYRIGYGKVRWGGEFGDTTVHIDIKNTHQDLASKIYLSADDEEPFTIIRSKDVSYQLSVNSATKLREDDLLVIGADSGWNTIKCGTYLTKTETVKTHAPYANYTLKSWPWDFNFGVRYDYNSEFGEEASPSAGAVYHLKNLPDTLVRAKVSRAFNAPLLLWKYNFNPLWGVIPNPNIGAERAWVYEAGVETRLLPKIMAKLSLYRADVSDAISWAENEIGEQYMKNFQKFRRQGVEFQFKIDIFEELSFFVSGAFNDIEDRTSGETVKGAGRPRQSFDLGIEYKSKNGFCASVKGYYDRWNQPASLLPNDRKMLFDARLSQEYKNITFFLNVYNLTNSKYWADYYFPVQERYFEGGTAVKW